MRGLFKVSAAVGAAIGAVLMAGNGALAASSSGHQVRLAPLAGALASTTQKSTSFAGYVASPAPVTSASATFTVPAITCGTATTGVGPGVFLAGSAPVFSGGGAEAVCSGGTASYVAAIIINSSETKVLTIAAGNTLSVKVTETSTATKVTLKDITLGTSKSSSGTGGMATEALLGDDGVDSNSILVGVPKFTTNKFKAALVQGKALGSESPVAFERVKGTTVQIAVSALVGGNSFTLTFKHH